MSWYLAAKILESLPQSGGANSSSEMSQGYGNVSVRTPGTTNQQIFAHLSYPFCLLLLCVFLKHQVPERGPVTTVSSHGAQDGNRSAAAEGNQRLGWAS